MRRFVLGLACVCWLVLKDGMKIHGVLALSMAREIRRFMCDEGCYSGFAGGFRVSGVGCWPFGC